jgi:hypothetical protein
MANSTIDFDDLPDDVKQKFYDIAAKGDWTAEEAYEHLVPESLRDNPEEIRAWMDGNPDIDVPDRDVSREVSGQNGGEYSTSNTAMEDSSVNRARGGRNMTEEEKAERDQQNAEDAQTIDDHYTEDEVTSISEAIDDVAEATLVTAVLEGAAATAIDFSMDVAAPVVGAGFATKYVVERCKTTKDKVGYGSLTAGGGVALLASPVGQGCIGLWIAYKLSRRAYRMVKKLRK